MFFCFVLHATTCFFFFFVPTQKSHNRNSSYSLFHHQHLSSIFSMNNNCPPIITQSCEEDYAIQQKSEPNGHSNCRFLIKELKGSSLLDHDPLMCNFRNDVLLFEACSKFSFLIKHLVDHSGDHQDEIKKRLSFPSGPRGDWTGKFDISDTLEIVTDLTQYVHDRYCDYPVIKHLNDADAKIREFASRRD